VVITTVLDPREPGRSLVGGLVRGIHGCFRVYVDEVAARERRGAEPRPALPTSAGLRTRFADDVRAAMRSLQ